MYVPHRIDVVVIEVSCLFHEDLSLHQRLEVSCIDSYGNPTKISIKPCSLKSKDVKSLLR